MSNCAKIIGISGGSGAGKSLCTRMLNDKLPNSVIINADDEMMKLLQDYDDELFKRLGYSKEKGVFSSNYFFKTYDNMLTFIDVINKPMCSYIRRKIQENSGANIILVDWAFLPLCDFFGECSSTIFVNAEDNERLNRITSRLAEETVYRLEGSVLNRYLPGILENRIKFTSFDKAGYHFDYVIDNSGSLEDLDKMTSKLASMLLKSDDKKVFTKKD